jgi:hypothetical protein
MPISAQYVPHQGCVATKASERFVVASPIYTMAFDLVIFLLRCVPLRARMISPLTASASAWKLGMSYGRTATPLSRFLFRDGLVYFIVVYALLLLFPVPLMLMSHAQRLVQRAHRLLPPPQPEPDHTHGAFPFFLSSSPSFFFFSPS